MNLCFVIVPKVQPDGRMTATFGQHHRPCLRIGSLAVLVATASKGRRVGLGIGYIEQAAVQGHQPIAPIPGTLGLGRTQEVCALLKEPLQRLHSQDGPLITEALTAPLALLAARGSDPAANGSVYPTRALAPVGSRAPSPTETTPPRAP